MTPDKTATMQQLATALCRAYDEMNGDKTDVLYGRDLEYITRLINGLPSRECRAETDQRSPE